MGGVGLGAVGGSEGAEDWMEVTDALQRRVIAGALPGSMADTHSHTHTHMMRS